MFYYIVLLILSIFALLDLVIPDKNSKKSIYIFLVIILILLGGFRWETGNDWQPYYTFFVSFDYNKFDFKVRFETGYVQFVRFIRSFTSNYTIFLLIYSAVIIGLKTHILYKFSNAILIALLLYWATLIADITAVRQAMAMSFCMLSLIFVVKQQPIRFIICVLLGVSFHASAFIFFIAYWIYNREWSVSFKVSILVISFILGALGTPNGILSFASDYLDNLFPYLSAKANTYQNLGEDLNYAKVSKSTLLLLGVIKRATIIPIFLYYENKISKINPSYRGISNLFVFGNCVYFLVIDFLTIQRMAAYFYPLEIILFCMIFDYVRKKSALFVIIVLYAAMKMFMNVSSAKHVLDPYISIFSENIHRTIK